MSKGKIIQGEGSTMQHRRFKGRDPMTSTAVIHDAIGWKRSHSKKQELNMQRLKKRVPLPRTEYGSTPRSQLTGVK